MNHYIDPAGFDKVETRIKAAVEGAPTRVAI
jgi:hypothetical protein